MELAWGRRYVMVEPTHFRIDYVINPFMDPADQPDPDLAMAQWRELVGDHRAARRHRRRAPAAPGRPRHGLRDEPRPRPGRRGRRAARRDVAHALRRAPDGDRLGAAVVRRRTASRRRTSGATASAPTSRPATCSRSATRWSSATARAPRSSRSSTSPPTSASGCAACGSPTRDVPPRPGLLPARRPPRDGLPGGARRRVGRGAARARARAAGAHRGGGADDVLRQLDRASATDRGDAGLPGPGARAARGVGLRGRARRRLGVPQGRRLDPLPDQPRRRPHRSRPAGRPGRRGAAAGGREGADEATGQAVGAQLPWNPAGTRAGRWTAATSSRVSASSSTRSLRSVAGSKT